MDYKNLTDEQLVEYSKAGDENALDCLMSRFKPMALSVSRCYFLVGGDEDDVMQEAMIGLYKACLRYSAQKGASFATFAKWCITKNVQSAVKGANCLKFQILNQSYKLSPQGEVLFGEESDEEIALYIPSTDLSPAEILIEHEKIEEIKNDIIKKLSDFEFLVFKKYLKGHTYIEIAKQLNQTPKTIDNALNRIKNKLAYLKN
ncbi:MAG: sigma-70 family RNA polymerase sigma factor [Clostridia bacterium]|nr:sigma-70 family RNA polymerase sigma factor [Clostridia bacterium]